MHNDSKVNILLVDDKPDKLLALEAVLEDLNECIVRAYSGREALRYVMAQEFAVILLDVNMPGMDGFETASLIRQRKNTEHVPIIFVTAYGDEDHRSRGYSIGAVDYIQTPIVPEVLQTKVSVFVDLFRKTEQVRRQAHWLHHRATQLHKLAEACLAINSAMSMDRILKVMTETARDIIGAHVAATILLRGGNWSQATTVTSASDSHRHWCSGRSRPKEDSIQGLVCKTNKSMRLSTEEMEQHSVWQASGGEHDAQLPVNGWLAAPLTGRDGHNMGMIEVCAHCEGEFSGDDEAILVQLAQMSSVAIANTIFVEERETNRIKDEFLSTLSHELRTPLNAILGWTQLLQRSGSEDKVRHGLEVIDRNAKAQAKLVEDLLDVSRITSGKLRLNTRLVDLKAIVQSAVEAIHPSAQSKHQKISYVASVEDGTMLGDPDRLPQAVWNLLVNAVKFTPAQGQIDVKLDSLNGYFRFRVSDTGKGIVPAFLPYVFDRFRQADSTSTRSHGGLGIGLAIVRHIVELHGGNVLAHSDGEMQGATFTVLLPVTKAMQAPAAEAPETTINTETQQIQLAGVSVLIVDDEADTREVVSNILLQAGAVTAAAASMAEAVKILEASVPHVIISDIAMPDEDGYDLIRRLRSSPGSAREVPAIAMTAYAREEDREKALSSGFQMHLAKPIVPVELLLAVQRLGIQKKSRGKHSEEASRGAGQNQPPSHSNISQSA